MNINETLIFTGARNLVHDIPTLLLISKTMKVYVKTYKSNYSRSLNLNITQIPCEINTEDLDPIKNDINKLLFIVNTGDLDPKKWH